MKTRTIERSTIRHSWTTRPSAPRAKASTIKSRRTSDLALRVILVPVDFSTASLNALHFALALARPFDARIELLHVLDPIHAAGRFDAPRLRQLRREALDDARRRLANVARRSGNGRLRHTVLSGTSHSAIVEKAVQIDASMIVMGSRGRTGLGRLLVGSVAEKVIRYARCPVLIVREDGGRKETSAKGRRSN